jgi:hypothetical protein
MQGSFRFFRNLPRTKQQSVFQYEHNDVRLKEFGQSDTAAEQSNR